MQYLFLNPSKVPFGQVTKVKYG